MVGFCDEDGFGPLISDGSAVSPCFSQSIIEPIFYFWFLFVAQRQQLAVAQLPVVLLPQTFSTRFNIKLALCFMQIIYPTILTIVIIAANMKSAYSVARFFSYVLRTIIWLVCTRLLVTEYSKAIIQSNTIRVFWFVQFIVDTIACMVPHSGDKELLTVFYAVNFILSLCLAVLSLYPDDIDLLSLLDDDQSKTVSSDAYYSLDGDDQVVRFNNWDNVEFAPTSGERTTTRPSSMTPMDPFTYTTNSLLKSALVDDDETSDFGYYGTRSSTQYDDEGARFTPTTSEGKMWQRYLKQSTIETSEENRVLVGVPKLEIDISSCSVNPVVAFTLDVRIDAEFDLIANALEKDSETHSNEERRWIVKMTVDQFLEFVRFFLVLYLFWAVPTICFSTGCIDSTLAAGEKDSTFGKGSNQ